MGGYMKIAYILYIGLLLVLCRELLVFLFRACKPGTPAQDVQVEDEEGLLSADED
jgi:hypothetical protein